MAGKLVIMCTYGPEEPERCTIPMVMATAAQASDVDVVLGLQVEGVHLARKGALEGVVAPKFPPLADLMAAFLEGGGKLLVCAPCAMARGFHMQEDLIEGAVVVGAAAFVSESLEATSTLVY